MSMLNRALKIQQNKSISIKFGGGVIWLSALMLLVSATGYLSLQYVRESNKSIRTSTEIQRLVLEMDRGMEKARYLHGQFYLQYPKIGLKKSHENYAQPSVRQISKVVTISRTLQNIIAKAEVSDALRKSNINLNLYLSSAKRFADTSIESVKLVTKLATPDEGLNALLDGTIVALELELSGVNELKEQIHEMDHLIHTYRIVRKRF